MNIHKLHSKNHIKNRKIIYTTCLNLTILHQDKLIINHQNNNQVDKMKAVNIIINLNQSHREVVFSNNLLYNN